MADLPSIDTSIPHSARVWNYWLGSDTNEPMIEASRGWSESAAAPYHLHSPEEIAGFFTGPELVEPGVVSALLWHPPETEVGVPSEVDQYCGVARKA